MRRLSKKQFVICFSLILLILILSVFLFNRNTTQNNSKQNAAEQEEVIKLRLIEEFEQAFIKQYTQPVGCDVFENEEQMDRCKKHRKQAKQDFEQEFIKNRGLPKDALD